MKYLIVLFTTFFSLNLSAQQNPVHWKFSAVKLAKGEYLVECTAFIDPPWHIYSKSNPEGIVAPTIVNFKKNPLIELVGTTIEKGELVEEKDKTTNSTFKYYNYELTIQQRVKIKQSVKTSLSGTINYMACDNTKCLPPASISFIIKLH